MKAEGHPITAPKLPPNGKLLSFREYERTHLGYEKRKERDHRQSFQVGGARADYDLKGSTQRDGSQRMSVRPGSPAGVRAVTPKPPASL